MGGTNGLLINSMDGGNNWNTLNIGISNDIMDLQMLNNNIGYVIPKNTSSTQNSSLLKTADSGNSWSTIDLGNVVPVTRLKFESESEGYIQRCDEILGQISYTSDGGNSFVDLFTSDIGTSIDFYVFDLQTIWIIGQDMRTSGNGGAYISLLESDNFYYENTYFSGDDLPPYTAIDFANNTTGYVVGVNGIIRKNTTGNNTSAVSKIDDNLLKIYPNPSNGQFSVKFMDSNIKPTSYTITDLQGKEIVPNTMINNNIITVTQLPNGVYLIKIKGKDSIYTQELIIQK